jgi:hypothetical protein
MIILSVPLRMTGRMIDSCRRRSRAQVIARVGLLAPALDAPPDEADHVGIESLRRLARFRVLLQLIGPRHPTNLRVETEPAPDALAEARDRDRGLRVA